MRLVIAPQHGIDARLIALALRLEPAKHVVMNDDYRGLIGAAVFSAGAGGSAGSAPAFCASGFGRAGSGGVSPGRVAVVAGSAGAEGFVSAPGVDCSGCVACAICW